MGSEYSKHDPLNVTYESLSCADPKAVYVMRDVNDPRRKNYYQYYRIPHKSAGMTFLMKCVLLTKERPELLDRIRDYVTRHPDQLNKKNKKGWTPLMIAVANTNVSSSLETVKLLLELGANVNRQSSTSLSPLVIACYLAGTTSNFETVKMLCEDRNIKIHQSCRFIDNRMDDSYNALTFALQGDNPNINVINYLIQRGVKKDMWIDDNQIARLQRSYTFDTFDARSTRDKEIDRETQVQ